MTAHICIIEECGRKLPERGTKDICSRCSSGHYYWRKRVEKDGAGVITVRKSQLTMLQSRFEHMPRRSRSVK